MVNPDEIQQFMQHILIQLILLKTNQNIQLTKFPKTCLIFQKTEWRGNHL